MAAATGADRNRSDTPPVSSSMPGRHHHDVGAYVHGVRHEEECHEKYQHRARIVAARCAGEPLPVTAPIRPQMSWTPALRGRVSGPVPSS